MNTDCKSVERKPQGCQPLEPVPEELKPFAEQLKSRFAVLNADYAQRNYDIGRLLQQEIPKIESALQAKRKKRGTYRAWVFQQLGKHLGIAPRVLYDCCKVAEGMCPEMFQVGVARGLTWRHACVFARLEDTFERDILFYDTIRLKLTVAQLRALNKKPHDSSRSRGKPRRLTQALARFKKTPMVFVRSWKRSLSAKIMALLRPSVKRNVASSQRQCGSSAPNTSISLPPASKP
jgi:hypothetical protein